MEGVLLFPDELKESRPEGGFREVLAKILPEELVNTIDEENNEENPPGEEENDEKNEELA